MNSYRKVRLLLVVCLLGMVLVAGALAAGEPPKDANAFPPSLESYNDADLHSIMAILKNRVRQVPFNLVATLIFFCAIVHTFLTSKFLAIAHKWEHDARTKDSNRGWSTNIPFTTGPNSFIFWVK